MASLDLYTASATLASAITATLEVHAERHSVRGRNTRDRDLRAADAESAVLLWDLPELPKQAVVAALEAVECERQREPPRPARLRGAGDSRERS